MSVGIVFIIIILVLLFCQAIGKPSSPISLGWLGLFFWALYTFLIAGGAKL